jgi:hypothetical protein
MASKENKEADGAQPPIKISDETHMPFIIVDLESNNRIDMQCQLISKKEQ